MADKNDRSLIQTLIHWTFRLAILLLVAGGVFIWALKLAEGYKDPLREGIEKYFAESAGYPATIEELSKVSFFPDVFFEIRNLAFLDPGDLEVPKMQAERIELSMPLWRMMLHQTVIEKLEIENLNSQADFLFPAALDLKKMELGKDEQGNGMISGTGFYNAQDMNFTVWLEHTKNKRGVSFYKLPRETKMAFSLAKTEVLGNLKRTAEGYYLENAVMNKGQVSWGPSNFQISNDKGFLKENPLGCLIQTEKNCQKYFEEENE